MHGRTLESLALRGLDGRFVARGFRVETGHFAGLATRLELAACDSTYPFTLNIPQRVTEELLEERALELGADLRRGVIVDHLVELAASVRVHATTEGEELTLEAGYLVGADGAHSVVRERAGIAFEGHPGTRTAMLGDVRLADPPPTPALSMTGESGGMMLVRLGDGLHRLIVVDAERVVVPVTEPVTLSELARGAERVGGRDFGLCEPVWLSRFSDETRLAACYRHGRILLAGDAAHIHLPAGGQGMNVGMQDAMNLGWKLAGVVNGFVSDALLDSYGNERRPVGAALCRNTQAQSALMTAFDPATRALREQMSELLRLPALNRRLADQLSGFDVRYEKSLTDTPGGWATDDEWTGRRLSDRTLRLEDGTRSSLYPQLRDGRWLLVHPARAAPKLPLDPRWVRAVQGTTEHTFGMQGIGALLVRPDGHVDRALVPS